MYKKLSKSGKGWFWITSLILLILLIYCITLIPFAGWFELVIAGLGWVYLTLSFIGWFGILPKILYAKNKIGWNVFFSIAIIGIIAAILIDFLIIGNANSRALPIIFIPAVLVTIYLVVGTIYMNFKKRK